MSLLTVTDLKVSYDGIEALKGINFQVEKGQIVTLIGANGAGKSTILRAISSLVPIKGGSINFDIAYYKFRYCHACKRGIVWFRKEEESSQT